MILRLRALPDTLRGPSDPDYGGRVPRRARFLAPEAAASVLEIERVRSGLLCYTDIFRSPEASLLARRKKRGVQRPGYSGHGFGLSIDLGLEEIEMPYPELLAFMKGFGWHCHRRDGVRGFEAWHWNYGVDVGLADVDKPATWGMPVEALIQAQHGADMRLSPLVIQAALAKLGLYGGAIDGEIGPLTREAVRAFQRAWDLGDDGEAGPATQRTLAIVSAERVIGG